MKPPEPVVELARAWLNKARGDLEFAYAGRDHRHAPGWGIGFHCQQAVEKAGKGALVLREVSAPRTHDLATLREMLQARGIEVPFTDTKLKALTPYAIDDRYPRLTLSEVTREEALLLIASAERAVAWLAAMVQEERE
jgi:HEPN domain-containing protein